MFTEKQLEVIRQLAGFYWDNHINTGHLPKEAQAGFRKIYIDDVIRGLTDPDVWG